MKKLFVQIAAFLSTVCLHAQENSRAIDFDKGWKFFKGEATGAEQTSFKDASWRSLNLPHDWSIEGPYDRSNPTGRGGGYLPAGIGWYRKTFSVAKADAAKKIFIQFDGVMANSDVWINGHHLGKRPNGYVAFEYELTPYLNFGGSNLLAVRADNTIQPASRWYAGAGIYRHVRLLTLAPVHVAQWGQFVTSEIISTKGATVHVQTDVVVPDGSRNISIQTSIVDPMGNVVATANESKSLSIGSYQRFIQKLDVRAAAFWSIEYPSLYKTVTGIFSNGKLTDEITTRFGIRDAHFEAATGFWLNGKNIKIKGVCLHQDGGAVGVAVPLSIWEKRLKLLKQIGVNGIRTAHNPPAPAFLDLCDRMGFVVMDETFDTWTAAKGNAEKGYNLFFNDWWEQDTRSTILNDRNHPSIVLYSVGNEIRDNLNDSTGFRKYKMQQDLVHSLDDSRPVTMALFRPGSSHVYDNGFLEQMDVVGQNYREGELVAAHEAKPERKVIGTENTHDQSAWIVLRDKPYMAGQFLWTGVEYLGEAEWPRIGSGSGLIDKTGEIKNNGYQRESWWSNQPMIYVMRRQGNADAGGWTNDWTPSDIDTYDEARLQVFSNCDEVELFLNNTSLGVKSMPEDRASPRTWTTTFQKGTLKAVGRNAGKIVATQELKTEGKASKILLTVDKRTLKNNWDDVVYVTATVTDDEGIPVPSADNRIGFNVSGAGVIAAVDNANLSSAEPYQANERLAYKGKCIAIIKANADKGKIVVSANVENLKAGSVTIDVK
jgi:beta-galactosidase